MATQAGSTRRKSMIASSALGPRGPVDVHDAPALRHLLEHHRLCTEQHQRFAVLLGMQFALAADPGEVAGGARATAHQLTVRLLQDRKSTRLNSSHYCASRMPSSDGQQNT